MSVRSAFNSIIKNIQRGSKTLGSGTSSATQTITAVVDGKTLINHLGQTTNNTAEDPQHVDTDLTFVNTTTISFGRANVTGSVTVSWEVIEFY